MIASELVHYGCDNDFPSGCLFRPMVGLLAAELLIFEWILVFGPTLLWHALRLEESLHFDSANDIASGDLPSASGNILIISDLTAAECTLLNGQDEGQAMMQLIHDVAPGTRLAF